MSTVAIKEKHPAGLYLCFATEMWERFSFYAMRGLFVLYLTKALMFQDARAVSLYGTLNGLMYMAPLAGGYIADRYWGQRRAIIVGAVFIILGQISMGIQSLNFIYTAIGLLTVGVGLLKPNISTIVGELYEKNDARRDSGFLIFYMGINLGALLGFLVTGILGEGIGWKWGFWSAAGGMVIGLAIFLWGKDKYLKGKGLPPAKNKELKAELKEEKKKTGSDKLTKEEWQRIIVIFVLAFFSIFFWTAYEQAGASLTLFADKFTDRTINLFGWHWEIYASWFQGIPSLFIIILAPVFAKFWIALAKKGMNPSIPAKFSIGLVMLALGYVVMVIGAVVLGTGVKIGMYFLVLTYLFHVFGELCLSPIGLSMITKLAPVKFISLFMGVWFASTAAAEKLAGTYSTLFGKISNVQFFTWLVIAPLCAAGVLALMNKPLKKWMHGIQ